MERYQDPNDPLNGKKYHTGKPCVEGCGRPAGTAWSKFWCHPCNAKRMDGIAQSINDILGLMVEQDDEWCSCGTIHDQDEIGGNCKSCGKKAD